MDLDMLLYKYMPLAWDNELTDTQKDLFRKRCHCIRDNRFWFSKPDLLNDPYDCKPYFKISKRLKDIEVILDDMEPEEIDLVLQKFPNCKSKDDIYKLFENIVSFTQTPDSTKDISLWILQTMVSKLVEVKIANTGVLSFSTNPTNIIMWAQYANNHNGICLEIDIPEHTNSLKEVRYTKQQPVFIAHEVMNEKHGRFLDLFYTKSIHWQHETEWRMVTRQGNEAKQISGAVIKQIIYGINVSNETKEKIAESIGQEFPSSQLKMKRNYVLHWDT